MILIGYQGIGKSTLAGKLNCIDLESGNFWIDGARSDDWYKPCCKIAIDLSSQGYWVFTSSHEVVRNYLKEINTTEKIYCIVPDLNLKDEWIAKLHDRYQHSNLEKDYKAYMNAKDRYTENIQEILNSGHKALVISDMNYNLYNVISLGKDK